MDRAQNWTPATNFSCKPLCIVFFGVTQYKERIAGKFCDQLSLLGGLCMYTICQIHQQSLTCANPPSFGSARMSCNTYIRCFKIWRGEKKVSAVANARLPLDRFPTSRIRTEVTRKRGDVPGTHLSRQPGASSAIRLSCLHRGLASTFLFFRAIQLKGADELQVAAGGNLQ